MTHAASVRSHLHALIDEVVDERLLEALVRVLEASAVQTDAAVGEVVNLADLPPAERAAVEEGLRQSDAGLGRPHAEVWAEYEARYGVKSPAYR